MKPQFTHTIAGATPVALAIALFIGLVDIGEAQACDPAAETIGWTVPADGDVITPETPFIFVVGGFFLGEDLVSVVDSEGNEIAGEQTHHSMARWFSGMREFVPDEPLADGEYTVRVDYEGNANFPNLEPFEMTVTVDANFELPASPEATDFDWYHETHDETQGDTCYMANEIHQVAVQPLAVEPAYFEMIFQHHDGSETIQLLSADAHDGSLRRYETTEVECISVVARLADGSGGEVNQICQPHKCKHYEGEELNTSLGATDWDEVSGCDGDGGEQQGNQEQGNQEQGNQEQGNQEEGNQEEGNQEQGNQEQGNQEQGNQEQGNQEQGNQEQGNQEEGNQEEGNQEEGNQEQEESPQEGETETSGEGSCSAASGSAPPVWMMLLIALGLVARRRL